MEREQVVSEVRRQAEVEKEIAIAETKKKKWVRWHPSLVVIITIIITVVLLLSAV